MIEKKNTQAVVAIVPSAGRWMKGGGWWAAYQNKRSRNDGQMKKKTRVGKEIHISKKIPTSANKKKSKKGKAGGPWLTSIGASVVDRRDRNPSRTSRLAGFLTRYLDDTYLTPGPAQIYSSWGDSSGQARTARPVRGSPTSGRSDLRIRAGAGPAGRPVRAG